MSILNMVAAGGGGDIDANDLEWGTSSCSYSISKSNNRSTIVYSGSLAGDFVAGTGGTGFSNLTAKICGDTVTLSGSVAMMYEVYSFSRSAKSFTLIVHLKTGSISSNQSGSVTWDMIRKKS